MACLKQTLVLDSGARAGLLAQRVKTRGLAEASRFQNKVCEGRS